MKNYKFSVSTSFFKRGDFVQQLYQQLLEQTHTNWEWIVTDDFSPEKNAEAQLRKICAALIEGNQLKRAMLLETKLLELNFHQCM